MGTESNRIQNDLLLFLWYRFFNFSCCNGAELNFTNSSHNSLPNLWIMSC